MWSRRPHVTILQSRRPFNLLAAIGSWIISRRHARFADLIVTLACHPEDHKLALPTAPALCSRPFGLEFHCLACGKLVILFCLHKSGGHDVINASTTIMTKVETRHRFRWFQPGSSPVIVELFSRRGAHVPHSQKPYCSKAKGRGNVRCRTIHDT